ncbi:MAG: ATP-binding cassette domain-containing protein [Candidatus Marinimicrobia bacterium]|nr:ATP-binding cassette domain-containing protein [Candidatus Neomarinimicrobiota bacterium]MDD5582905.1 ATP-binding cassette domain-containing protein [Candidatus Neomarinimicrobiota bacterium]
MITVDHLTKYYGHIKAVDDISFHIKDGEILGFLGPNGAGKSTTLRIITSYLMPTSGNIYINDMNILDDSLDIRKNIGYLPENNPLYSEMNVYDFLKFSASIRGIEGEAFEKRLKEVIELCGLYGVIHNQIGKLSKGYRQRTGLAQSIFHNPEILILDEPTAGLDPNQIVEIRSLIKQLGKEKTVIISSHILQEIQATADRMVIINKGKIAADGTIDDLMSGFKGCTRLHLEIEGADSFDALKEIHENVNLVQVEPKKNSTSIVLEYPNTLDLRKDVFQLIVKKGWTLLEMNRYQTSLEDLFRILTMEEGGEV